MRGHVVLSLKQLAGNSCKVPENVLCPAVIVSPALSRISHLSGSHVSLTHAIDYNAIAKEIIRLAKKFKYRFTHH